MISEEKIKELKKMLRSGVPAGEVKQQLIQEGYTDEDINKVFTPHRYDMRLWYLISAVIILAIGIFLYLQHETTMNLIIILFSVFLFYQYFRENRRIKS